MLWNTISCMKLPMNGHKKMVSKQNSLEGCEIK